jgi:BirA family biotin operon repressor/biotin-[acetyl-CoA-carboxylase] ligase
VIEPLDAATISAALPSSAWHVDVVVETDSTNADLRNAASQGTATVGQVLVAEHQRAGRGRLGRRWESAPGAGLTFSALVSPTQAPLDRWGWLPLLTGLAVAEAVEAVAGVPLKVKWPNDVLSAGGLKIAGVLCERVDVAAGPLAVVGIGLNVTAGPDQLPVPAAASLAMLGATTTDRPTLLGAILDRLATRLADWLKHGGDAAAAGLLDAYAARSATLGRQVVVAAPGGAEIAGEATHVDLTGALVLRTVDGARTVAAGDVTGVE